MISTGKIQRFEVGSGYDVLKLNANGNYDLTGVDWGSIDKLSRHSQANLSVRIDEEVALEKFSGSSGK